MRTRIIQDNELRKQQVDDTDVRSSNDTMVRDSIQALHGSNGKLLNNSLFQVDPKGRKTNETPITKLADLPENEPRHSNFSIAIDEDRDDEEDLGDSVLVKECRKTDLKLETMTEEVK